MPKLSTIVTMQELCDEIFNCPYPNVLVHIVPPYRFTKKAPSNHHLYFFLEQDTLFAGMNGKSTQISIKQLFDLQELVYRINQNSLGGKNYDIKPILKELNVTTDSTWVMSWPRQKHLYFEDYIRIDSPKNKTQSKLKIFKDNIWKFLS